MEVGNAWNHRCESKTERRRKKTFDEIEQALKICSVGKGAHCEECPYNENRENETCRGRMMSDARMVITYQWGHIKRTEDVDTKQWEV